jgi:hypothetical protein
MSKFSILIQNLKRKLFGSEQLPSESPRPITPAKETKLPDTSESLPTTPLRSQPYLIQIGFDFGTSYSKCICRDVNTEKAWVYIPPKSKDYEYPFLIPGAMLINDGMLRHVENQEIHYPENGLYHLKHALVKTALQQLDDPVLAVYKNANGQSDLTSLPQFVENCAVYYLAGTIGDVREGVRRRLPDFGALPDDYMAVNLAVPVADAERPQVNDLYHRVLSDAWRIADKCTGHPPMHLTEIESLRKENKKTDGWSSDEACFIYPEVSANVQGFVRSRVSAPGMYLFSDTGAGTVDQSVFIFARRNQEEHLVYLYGTVLPLGSSLIEHRAAMSSGNTDWQSLEIWRERKERDEAAVELSKAKEWIAGRLNQGTESTLAFARQKLYVTDQLNDIRVIFGGGGHCDYPYKTAVMRPFSGNLFRRAIQPDVIGLPIPGDLELKDSEARWMRRLYVAYGLSFEKNELTGFTYPKDVSIPEPQQIWAPRRQIPDAPGNDQC